MNLCSCGHPKDWHGEGGCILEGRGTVENLCFCPAFKPVEAVTIGELVAQAAEPEYGVAYDGRTFHVAGDLRAAYDYLAEHFSQPVPQQVELDEEELERVILDQIMATVSLSRVKGKPKGVNWVRCCSEHGDLYEFVLDREAMRAALIAWARKGR